MIRLCHKKIDAQDSRIFSLCSLAAYINGIKAGIECMGDT